MNYSELIEQLAEQTGNSQAQTKEVLEDAISVLSEQLSLGKGVSIPDLGTFTTRLKQKKKVYNPHYEAYIVAPPKRVVEFTPASGLKENVKYVGGSDE